MKIKIYMTFDEYKRWKDGEEVVVNNLDTHRHSKGFIQETKEIKIEAYISEQEIIEMKSIFQPNGEEENIQYCEWTIKKQ